jgi:hypothetical protein
MTERDGIKAARVALAAYRAGLSPVEEPTAIIDLIADLMHVADGTSGDGSISGEYAVDRAAEYYRDEDGEETFLVPEDYDERDDEDDDEDDFDTSSSASRQHYIDTGRYLTHDESPYGDEGQTVPDDPNIPAGAPKPTDRLCSIPCDGTGYTGNPRERCTTHYQL